jgi:hypothetical protein
MVNVNPHNDADKLNHHTHYLTFKNKYDYVRRFWEENTDVERCWLPWDWCQTQSLQFKNNSIVIFSPSNDTLHAVKAAYNHLKGQRTQLYGNLWNKSRSDLLEVKWENLDICNSAKIEDRNSSFERKLRRLLPQPVKQAVRVIHKTRGIHTRNY